MKMKTRTLGVLSASVLPLSLLVTGEVSAADQELDLRVPERTVQGPGQAQGKKQLQHRYQHQYQYRKGAGQGPGQGQG